MSASVNDQSQIHASYVVARLEEAGMALLALPGTGYSTRLQTASLDIVRAAIEAYGWTAEAVRPRKPTAAEISEMDEALAWLRHIPLDRYVLRRIVGARALVHPISERHLYTWRRIAAVVGANHTAVQRWHAEAIGLIVAQLHRREFNFPS